MARTNALTPSILFLYLCVGSTMAQTAAPSQDAAPAQDVSKKQFEKWWGSSVDKALERSGDTRSKWESTLNSAPQKYRVALEFLFANMPKSDFAIIQPELLMENIELAYQAREAVAWGRNIPEEIFLNDVLPYCHIDEPRDPWRRDFFDRFIELAKGCKSPGEVAQKLNETAFKELEVKYSTKRKRANQSPKESIEQGLASCTGLSIILADACRAVCVPARLTGIAKWPKKNGNHTWVEVWDGKENGWRFTGAAEPSKDGLNHAWFERDAATAIADSPISSILAVSYGRTKTKWPLVWAEGSDQISAVNVTERYTKDDNQTPVAKAEQETFECKITVRDKNNERIAATVSVVDVVDATKSWFGHSRDESADTNDILLLDLPKNRDYRITVIKGHLQVSEDVLKDRTTADQNITIQVPDDLWDQTLDAKVAEYGTAAFSENADPSKLPAPPLHVTRTFPLEEQRIKQILWKSYCSSDQHRDLKEDFEANRVRFEKHESPYTTKEVGERGPNGWPLFIAMHGGGGAPAEVNDSQWKHMQIYYRDQQSVPGYKYLALRAPNNTWNGFYDDYVYPLIHELIRQQVLFNDVDPNRVYIMGYSHGGYGAFAIGPKMPDHFAAIHSSAAAPTGGATVGDTLRNTRFTYMIGAKDTSYKRATKCQAFAKSIETLRGERTDIYPVTMLWQADHGHGGLPDRDLIKDMVPYTRNPVPRELTWTMTDSVIKDFFWLSCDSPAKKKTITASCKENVVDINVPPGTPCSVWLDSRLVDFSQPIKLTLNGQPFECDPKPSIAAMAQSMNRRHDLFRSFSCKIEIPAQ